MGHALAHLRARLGAFDAAREEVDRYRGFLLDTGQLNAYWRAAEVGFDVEMLAGDVQAAADVAEEAHAKLSERGDRWPYLCAFLAQARFGLGKYTEASEAAEIAASSANSIERALGLGVLARIRARKGDATAGRGADRRGRRDRRADRLPVRPRDRPSRSRRGHGAARPRRGSACGPRASARDVRGEGRPRVGLSDPRSARARVNVRDGQSTHAVAVEPRLRAPDRVERVRAFHRDVALARVDDELDLGARGGDRVRELPPLPDRRAPILGALEHEGRRAAPMGVGHRRALDVLAPRVVPSPSRIISSYIQTSDVRWNET